MTDTVIYHNPRCSKSRETLALLRGKGVEPRIVEYLVSPPDVTQLKSVLGKLGLPVRAIIRTKEPEYAALGLAEGNHSDDELLALLVQHPKLIERPIVVRDGKAAIGRPPEKVLDIL